MRIATEYEKGGAACMSVLTDEKFFQGSFDNLKLIRNAGVNVRPALSPTLSSKVSGAVMRHSWWRPRLGV